MFAELFRVLRKGGRVLLSGAASDEDVPERLRTHPTLAAAGITGTVREDELVQALESASFYGIQIVERGEAPRVTIEGIELRDLVVVAYKGKEGPCWECNQALIYRGPFKRVEDDDGHVLHRGVRIAVCEKTFRIFSQQPYRDHVELVQPAVPVAVETAEHSRARRRRSSAIRGPRRARWQAPRPPPPPPPPLRRPRRRRLPRPGDRLVRRARAVARNLARQFNEL
jgi:arsenite methyltransferase